MEEKIKLNKSDFSPRQWEEIERGKEQGLDVSIYAHPYFDHNQMSKIRIGLSDEKIDVSYYAVEGFSAALMTTIMLRIHYGQDVEYCKDAEFIKEQQKEFERNKVPERYLPQKQ